MYTNSGVLSCSFFCNFRNHWKLSIMSVTIWTLSNVSQFSLALIHWAPELMERPHGQWERLHSTCWVFVNIIYRKWFSHLPWIHNSIFGQSSVLRDNITAYIELSANDYCMSISSDRNNSGLSFDIDGWPCPSNGVCAYLLQVVSTGSVSPILDTLPDVIPLRPWEPLTSIVYGNF